MKIKLLIIGLLLLSAACSIHGQVLTSARDSVLNPYTLAPRIKQSTMHDALQYYYARNGLTFYFKRVTIQGQGVQSFEVIDLVNHKNLGNLSNFVEELHVPVDPMTGSFNDAVAMDSFLLKYNGKFTYIMTKLTPTKEDHTPDMCTQIMKEILKRNANLVSDDVATLIEAYKGNGYFDIPGDLQLAKSMSDSFRARMVAQVSGKAHSSFDDIGGSSSLAGNLGRGAAKFLIERANEEINAAFFRRLKKAMDCTPELQKLFPNVYELTHTIETYNFDVALNTLKTKLQEDLEQLLGNIPMLAEVPSYQEKLNDIPELTYFFAICDILNGLKADRNAASIIHKVYGSTYVSMPATNEANVLQFAGLLSFSLRDIMLSDESPDGKGWISPTEFRFEPEVLVEVFKYYMGFLAQVDPGVVMRFPDKRGVHLRSHILSSQASIQQHSSFISDVYYALEQINRQFATIKDLSQSETTDMVNKEKFVNYKNIALSVLDIADRTVAFPGLFENIEREEIREVIADFKTVYVPSVEKVLLIVTNLEQKHYNEAVFDAGELISLLLQKVDSTKQVKTAEKLFKYGQFFASVATAENGDQVKDAIDAVALPTGSSSLKKELNFNIAVNGYIGYFSRNVKDDDQFVTGFTQSYGITAPIGFTFSTGFRKAGSASLFTGILDVGAIAQYELETDPNSGKTTAEPEIDWGNILSPSAQIVYGFPFYLPVSAGVGYQWLANTASVEDDNFKLKPRFNFFIAFDIPIVNIASVKRAKR